MDETPAGGGGAAYPVDVVVERAVEGRNRLTTAFRIVLAIPHLLLVGGPVAAVAVATTTDDGASYGVGGGVLGVVALVVAVIAWFAILFTGRYPEGLWKLVAYYLRWRVRAVAYTALLRDEYPPFGAGPYPAWLELGPPSAPRNRLTVAFRLILLIPHLIVLWFLGIAWFLTAVFGWFAILLTGRFPAGAYDFGVGVLRWSTRVEVYGLLLRDEYPPFSLS